MQVEPIVRGALKRFTDDVGKLWTSLADYYIRLGHFEKARDIFEEGIHTVITVSHQMCPSMFEGLPLCRPDAFVISFVKTVISGCVYDSLVKTVIRAKTSSGGQEKDRLLIVSDINFLRCKFSARSFLHSYNLMRPQSLRRDDQELLRNDE